MIMLSRLNGQPFALNPDLIERAESTPDTVLTLVDGTRLVVSETVPEIINRIRWLRASVLAVASRMDADDLGDGVSEAASPGHNDAVEEMYDNGSRVVPITRGL